MSELSLSDIERLIRKDAPGIYQYYLSEVKPRGKKHNRFLVPFYMMKDMFMVFLMKLTPIRRLFYTVALLMFLYGMWLNSWDYALFSFLMFNLLLAFELADKLSAKDELDTARKIQMNMMPSLPDKIRNFSVVCFSETAKQVGGDYCNFIPSPTGIQDYLMIGDISGKGMSAALHMVQVHTIINHLARKTNDNRELMVQLNREVSGIFSRENFFTASLVSLTDSRQLKLYRAGHLPAIHYSVANGKCEIIRPQGIGLGLTANGLFDKALEEYSIETGEGDLIVLFTDGITEAMSPEKELFGEERLIKLIETNAFKSPNEIKNRILHRLRQFTNDNTFEDDITLIILKNISSGA